MICKNCTKPKDDHISLWDESGDPMNLLCPTAVFAAKREVTDAMARQAVRVWYSDDPSMGLQIMKDRDVARARRVLEDALNSSEPPELECKRTDTAHSHGDSCNAQPHGRYPGKPPLTKEEMSG